MFCGTLLTIKVESLLLAGFLSLAQRKGGVGKSVRRDFNLNYEEERRILSSRGWSGSVFSGFGSVRVTNFWVKVRFGYYVPELTYRFSGI